MSTLIIFCLFLLGYWNIIIHGRKHSYRLYTKLLNEAIRWTNAIQGAIDSKVPIETPTQQLIRDIKVPNIHPTVRPLVLIRVTFNSRHWVDNILFILRNININDIVTQILSSHANLWQGRTL